MKRAKKLGLVAVLALMIVLSVAVFTACQKTYTVTFMDGTTTLTSLTQKIKEGPASEPDAADRPTAPEGHVFKYWSLDQNGAEEYKWETPVTKNITLYAVWEKTELTVTFMNGSSKYDTKPVSYGSAVTAPTPPANTENKFFRHWSLSATGAESENAYNFAAAVTQNLTLHAVWYEFPAADPEFLIGFDLNYGEEGAPADPAAQRTVGNKLINLPDPAVRSGYSFQGWWISMHDDAEKLTSCAYAMQTSFAESTTLYALWHKTSDKAAPLVQVNQTEVSWNSVTGTDDYRLEITGPVGFEYTPTESHTLKRDVNFADAPAGEYTIKVTTLPLGSNSSVTTRHYINKALARVSVIEVKSIDGKDVLSFNAVENALKYKIIFSSASGPQEIDNNSATTFDFTSYPAPLGGFSFVIKAEAANFVTSESKAFAWDRNLGSVTGFAFDQASQVLSWDAVDNAAGYDIEISCTDETHNHSVTNITDNYIILEFCAKGEISVTVTPTAAGWNSAPADYTLTKTAHATPRNVSLNNTIITWSATGAESYEVKFTADQKDDILHTVNTNSIDLNNDVQLEIDTHYSVSIMSKGASAAENSFWSSAIAASTAIFETFDYNDHTVTWAYVIGAEKYQIRLYEDDSTIIDVTSGNTADIPAFSRSGEVKIQIRVVQGDTVSEWVDKTITVYKIAFFGEDEVTEIADPLYAATGDSITLPTQITGDPKYGHAFSGWETGDGEVYDFANFTGSEDLKLFARWELATYTVTLDYGIENQANDTYNVKFGDTAFNFTPVIYNRPADGFQFVGWYTKDNENNFDRRITDELGKSLIENWDIGADVTLYAKWTETAAYTLIQDGTQLNNTYIAARGSEIDLVEHMFIPEKVDGKTVSSIGQLGMRYTNSALREITFTATVTVVAGDAFANLNSLEAIYVLRSTVNTIYRDEDGVLIQTIKGETKDTVTIHHFPIKREGEYTVPSAVTSINTGTFMDRTGLTSIILPEGLTSIGNQAFSNTGLTIVNIPSSVTLIDEAAFEKNSKLTTVIFDGTSKLKTIDISAFLNCIVLTNITIPASVETIGDHAFQNCFLLGSLTFGRGSKLTSIGVSSFDSSGLTSIEIPGTVTLIDDHAFAFCSGLKTLTFADGDAGLDIGTSAGHTFRNCISLSEIHFPARVETIASSAFLSAGLTKVTFAADSRLTIINSSVFSDCNKLVSVNLPESITQIGATAFINCSSLTTINLPDSITVLNDQIFSGCQSLNSITLPENITSLGAYMFASTGLISIIIPENITSIGSQAFYNCKSLNSITFEGEVTRIGSYAFQYCASLTSIVLPASVTTIENFAFDSSGLTSFELPASLSSIGTNVFTGTAIDTFTVNSGNTSFTVDEFGVLYKGTALIACPPVSLLTTYTVTAGTTSIGANAFDGITGLESITFESRATGHDENCEENCTIVHEASPLTIGAFAFRNTGITSIIIPEGVSNIGNYAFDGCIGLASVTLPSTLKTIGEYAFRNNSFTSIVLPESVSGTIGRFAFAGCTSLISIIIPANVTELGNNVFDGCTSLSTITLPSGLKKIGSTVFLNCSALTSITIPSTVTSDVKAAIFNGAVSLIEIIVEEGNTKQKSTLDGTLLSADGKVLRLVPGKKTGDYTVPEGVTSFDGKPFQNCSLISKLILPSTLSSFSASYVEGMIGLLEFSIPESNTKYSTDNMGVLYNKAKTTLLRYPLGRAGAFEIPSTVTNIDVNAFDGAHSLTEITFAERTKTVKLSNSAFQNCVQLSSIIMPDGGISTIGNKVFFGCTSLTSIIIPNGVTSIGTEPFGGCSQLTTINFSANVAVVKATVFTGCTALTTINILGENSTMVVKDGILYNKDKTTLIYHNPSDTRTEFEVPETVTTIGEYAFKGCINLTEIVLPASLEIINNYAFDGCTSLSELIIPVTVSKIGAYAFKDCTGISSIYIPNSVTLDGYVFSNWMSNQTVNFQHIAAQYANDASYRPSSPTWDYNWNASTSATFIFDADNTP